MKFSEHIDWNFDFFPFRVLSNFIKITREEFNIICEMITLVDNFKNFPLLTYKHLPFWFMDNQVMT